MQTDDRARHAVLIRSTILLFLGACGADCQGTTRHDETPPLASWSGLIPPLPVSEGTAPRFSVAVSSGKTVVDLDGFSVIEAWTSPAKDRKQSVLLDWHGFSGGASHSYSLFADVMLRQACSDSGEATGVFEIAVDVSYTPFGGKDADWAWSGVREIQDRLALQGEGIEVTIVRRPN